MNKLIATLLIILTSANAFTLPSSRMGASASIRSVPFPISSSVPTASSTALALKVKVDPDAKGNNNAAGNAKMAAYGGSVLVAVALPFIFLIWSAIGK